MAVSGLLGYCTGYFATRLANKAAWYGGAGFVGLQFLSYKGWVSIHWDKVLHDFREGVSSDKHTSIVKEVVEIVSHKVPRYAAFSVGFWQGWKRAGLKAIESDE